jgi:myo-inositol-1(or 4)-monophosphatase
VRVSQSYANHLEVAEAAARRAGELLIAVYGHVQAREKAPFDLVTDADIASQRAVAEILSNAFPDHTLLAEEEGAAPEVGNPWRWIVDPLDGTINFAHGVPLWCVSIALEHAGDLVVGVVHHPLSGTFHTAARGQGARLNGRPIHVSISRTLATSLIVTGMPTDFASDADRQLAYFARMSTRTHSVRRTGTSAWNLAMVASGGFDVCYATSMHPWDAAAGVALIREAGGTVTGIAGQPYDLYGGGILATNGLVHEEVVRAMSEAWAGRKTRDG